MASLQRDSPRSRTSRSRTSDGSPEVQQVSDEVRIKLIEQLPEFRKLAADAINSLAEGYTTTMKSFDEGDHALREAFEQWRRSLDRILELPDITFEQRLELTREIGRTVELQSQKEAETKGAKVKLLERLTIGIGIAAGIAILAVVGGKMSLEQGNADDA
ncbi:hypothetical protein DEI92_02600 [Curtobacterium sp. MCBD17_034]|uniref:hypothetical protein n=1 Tax=unclassified Curtobacterium TaxID=257496 RepID=UPI000DA843A9|nr:MULTISPECIES: hypothetical protein [unclassified Curtobacterium]PZF62398.1 hypothetical protein DEI92_02600 [Curtobacterium sp. MCBD17_034]PZM39896.1 hypothetical protein DEI90_03505 [Curtobacterium sp. MCBD17_031]